MAWWAGLIKGMAHRSVDQGTSRPHLLRATGGDKHIQRSHHRDRFQELCDKRETKAKGCSGGDEDKPKQNKKPDEPLKHSVGECGKENRHAHPGGGGADGYGPVPIKGGEVIRFPTVDSFSYQRRTAHPGCQDHAHNRNVQ